MAFPQEASSPPKSPGSRSTTSMSDQSSLSRGECPTFDERLYFEGFREGLRRRDAEVAALELQVNRLKLENTQLKVQVQELEKGKVLSPLVAKATDNEDSSSNGGGRSFVQIPQSSSSIAPAPSRPRPTYASISRTNQTVIRTNNRYGIPNYLSVFRSREAETALRELMTKARAMDRRALIQIKNMCREAHATPRESKSWAQTFILSEWRNPPELASPSTRDSFKPTLPNPRMGDSFESWFDYYSVHSTCLPRGVRRDAHGKPWKPDLRASRIAAQLRPLQTSPIFIRTEFNYLLMELLGTSGEYERIVYKHRLEIASDLSAQPYAGPSPVSIEDVVSHMAACGVSLEAVRDDLEPWSRQYKSAGMAHGAQNV
ncbi:hypothetical protein VNI00_018077 [Paramarasmius palmivorus]|uniref:Uncharacterized protein n=1 Tax=Paramarasmius palmivorus TaxID=297713 RepID=A0AAW0B2F5_9AGAR